jgi:phosphoglycolate phosphatase
MNTRKRFHAVLFDLDGTLLNTLDDLAESVNAALVRWRYPVHPVDAYKQFVGNGAETMIRRALPPEAGKQETIDRVLNDFEEIYAGRYDLKTRPYPGIPEMLDALKDRSDIKRAVLSNKPHAATLSAVESMLGAWEFDVVMGARPGIPVKPDPTSALEIAATLSVDPGDMLYVGDSSVDMRTATAAEMYPVGVSWGFRSVSELQENGAAEIVDSPAEILRFLP